MTATSGIEAAIQRAGGRQTFADSLNPPVSVQAICQWVKRGWVPHRRALEIEQLYGVDRTHLVKPDLVALAS